MEYNQFRTNCPMKNRQGCCKLMTLPMQLNDMLGYEWCSLDSDKCPLWYVKELLEG